MSIIKYYDQLYRKMASQPVTVQPIEEVFVGNPILPDAQLITLAEYDPVSKDAITAHHLKDYRHKTFTLMLLPKVEVMFDSILEGSPYWNALLHNDRSYS